MKRLGASNKKSKKARALGKEFGTKILRFDVVVKGILRCLRKHYIEEFNEITEYKLKKRYREP